MMANKCYIKKEDKVKVIVGKDKGKIGKVLSVNRKKKPGPGRENKYCQTTQQTNLPEQTGWNCRKRNADPMVQCHGDV